jgi:uncharacterized peroxidase-related enzyme
MVKSNVEKFRKRTIMPWIDIIDETEAEGKLKEVYEDILESRGKVSNIMRIHSLRPRSMRAHLDLYVELLFSRSGLTREEREMIGVAVSAANGCDYCVRHHAEALNFYWKDDARIEKFVRGDNLAELPERASRIVEYTTKLTKEPAAVNETDVETLRGAGLTDEEILDTNLVASYFNFANRVVQGLGVEFSEDEVRGYKY